MRILILYGEYTMKLLCGVIDAELWAQRLSHDLDRVTIVEETVDGGWEPVAAFHSGEKLPLPVRK
jgi:hypothetical protein